MQLTWLDSNSWLIEMAGSQILLDPWLVGDLVFGNAPWFFKATRPQFEQLPVPSFILLSQGLPDHAHPETLKQLDAKIPVIGSPSAAQVATDLGFQTVTALEHGGTFTWGDRLQIQAFPGAPIGPMLTENAYVLTDLETQTRLYYEPHGYHAAAVQELAPIDVVIAPLVDLMLPLVGAFIRGGDRALELVQWLQPQVVLPTTAAAEVEYGGLLTALLKEKGSLDEFCDRMQQVAPQAQLIRPEPGQPIPLTFMTPSFSA